MMQRFISGLSAGLLLLIAGATQGDLLGQNGGKIPAGKLQGAAQQSRIDRKGSIVEELKKLLAPKHKEVDLEIEGLVVDQTQSKLGRDFYDAFFTQWSAPPSARNYTIVISEKPIAQSGTIIMLRINDEDVFDNILQPRLESIEEAAAAALETAYGYLENYELIQQELQGDDMQGSGIF